MKKKLLLIGIVFITFNQACSEAPKKEKHTKIEKTEISAEEKALEEEMMQLDEDIEALEAIKK
jgi:hypothetical protein